MEFRERFNRAVGLFVEMPPTDDSLSTTEFKADPLPAEAQVRTVDEIVRQSDGPNLDEISVPDTASVNLSASRDGTVDFATVYSQAGLPAAPFTAEHMLDLLNSLPQDLPLETRRQTVKVTLSTMGKSIGATSETIVADASRKLAALTSYADSLSNETKHKIATSEATIANLQAQIEAASKEIAGAKSELDRTLRWCSAESNRLDDVLEFFSLDIPPSKLVPDR